MTHHIVWTFDRDYVTPAAECDDPDCISRYVCEQDCELIYGIRRDEDGGVSHDLIDWEGEVKPHMRHQMTKGAECNVLLFLEDSSLIPELHDGREPFEIGRTAIEPVWQGDDGMLWKRATPTPDPQETQHDE